jgi:hypothetical protein
MCKIELNVRKLSTRSIRRYGVRPYLFEDTASYGQMLSIQTFFLFDPRHTTTNIHALN